MIIDSLDLGGSQLCAISFNLNNDDSFGKSKEPYHMTSI